MIKPTPNPPKTEPVPHDPALDPKKLKEAANRALNFYLKPASLKPRAPSTIFLIAPDIDTETLLANACESLASASVMMSDFAGFLDGTQRNTMLGIQQVIMLGELAVNRALDNLEPAGATT
ncbi:DUF6124 family protein [Pseudomonas sp. N3-W]|uniref:DUF6124 family protein n=1 Tax=Pseudomonas fungipugnans TaxID=3024217 RepID=A0ABT6QNK5_9PSED|nr:MULTISPECIES: DUF6124 family protein [unclassified Pseudomonas]MDI2592408.1 DUF6124 family protein [Pseudomonas sp. 681]UWF48892.1 DUF6124 family protein [Pseudomonas sp. N3-W]